MSTELTPPQPPRLPDPGREVDARYVGALLNVLRLFFNQIKFFLVQLQTSVVQTEDDVTQLQSDVDAIEVSVGEILGASGARFIQAPHGYFLGLTSQTLTVTVPNTVAFGTAPISNDIALVGSAFVPVYAGVYRLSAQSLFLNTTGAAVNASFWVRVNGVDNATSAMIVSVPAGGTTLIQKEVLLSLAAADSVQIMASTDGANTSLAAYSGGAPAFPVHRPAAMATLTLVSAPVPP